MTPKVIFLMADYGNDPTETAMPFTVFQDAGFEVVFATEKGVMPQCDEKMISGVTGKLLGAAKPAIAQHKAMLTSPAWQAPQAWTSNGFSLTDYDCIFAPGGHDKGMQQIISSQELQVHIAAYMALLSRSGPDKKVAAAICHGVQVLAAADAADGSGKSALHDFETASLPAWMEEGIFWSTRLFLGDYYKTFGAGTPSVEAAVRARLDEPQRQYKGSMAPGPFVHEDPKYNYLSARYPPDAELLANRTVALIKSLYT